MPDFQTLLDQAAASIASTPGAAPAGVDASSVLNDYISQKKEFVKETAASKKQVLAMGNQPVVSPTAEIPDFYQVAAGRGNQAGAMSMSPLETDLRNMQPLDLYLKYGSEGVDLSHQRAEAGRDYLQDKLQGDARTEGEVAFDSLTGVASGFVGGVGGIAALGTGLIDAEAGAYFGNQVQEGMQWGEEQQSEGINAARRIQRAETALDMRDNAALREREIAAGDSEIVAGMRRWGRDIVDTLGNSVKDPTMLGQGTSEAVGSLLVGGPVAKGLKALGGAAMSAAGRVGVSTTGNAATRLAALGERAAWPAATAILESGGAYSSTSSDVMGMSFEELEQNSPTFRELIAEGMTPEEAQLQVANRSALFAAAIQAPIAAAAGTLTRFAETPFRVPSLGSAVSNTLVREPIEEAIQSTTGGLAQNIGVRRFADEARVVEEGVGEQTALGGLYGSTSAGAVQGPGAAVQGSKVAGRVAYQSARRAMSSAINTAKEAGKPIFNFLIQRGEEIIRQNEKASPVADEVIATAASNLASTAPVDTTVMAEGIQLSTASPEEKLEGDAFIERLAGNLLFDSATEPDLPEAHRATLEGSITRADAIQRMAREVARLDGNEQLTAAGTLWMLLEPMQSMQESYPAALDSIPEDHPAQTLLNQYTQLIADIDNTPSVQRALRAINEMVAKAQTEAAIQPVPEEALGTVEGQQNIRNAMAVASLHPDKGNIEANEQILAHAASGRLALSPQQQATLRASLTLLRARRKMEEQIAASGLRQAKDVVSEQVVAGNDPLRKITKSALQHTQEILSAKRGDNNELATARLEDFGKFVQHMQNKLEAYNLHFTNGDPLAPPVKYQALQPTEERDFKEATKGVYVNTRSPKSIDQAQSVALEAQILADVYNGLVETFPELAQARIEPVSLVPELQGKADDLAQEFRAGRTPTPAQTPTQETTTDGQQEESQVQESTGTTESETVELDTGTETESEESGARPELEPREEITDQPQTHPVPLALQVERIDDDTDRYAFSFGGVDVGYVDVGNDGQVQASSVKEAYRGMGVGKSMYLAVIEKLAAVGKILSSDGSVTKEAARVWQSLSRTHNVVRNPTAFQNSNGHWLTEDGGPVFTAQIKQDTNAPQVKQEVVEETPAPEGIAAAYPNLFQGVKNFFIDSFRFPEEPKTRLYAEESPAETVRRALSSNMRMVAFLTGSQVRHTLTPEAASSYEALLSMETKGNTLGHLLKNVSDNLTAFLNKPRSAKDKTTIRELLESGTEANRWKNGKALNLLADDMQYQQQFLEQAGLATMQWLLTANNYETNMDEQDVADLTGVPVVQLSSDLIERVSQGLSKEQAVRSLGQKISSYWGLDTKPDADLAYAEGIPQSIAAEMIRGLREMGLLNIETTEITKEEFGVDEPRTIQRYIPSRLPDNDPLRAFPDAIETVAMLDPEHTHYFGDDRPPVAQRQMNNSELENTAAQKDALAKEQETPFYINRPMVNFFTSLGVDGLLSLFGTVGVEPQEDGKPNPDWNINDLKSRDGQNRSIVSAFNHMLDTTFALENRALTENQDMDEVPIHYGYNMSRVGRMQMLGKYNPQASKLVREAFLPTRTTLDLSNQNSEAWDAYSLGLAQAMGVKVHNLPLETSQLKLDAMLNGGLAPAVQMLQRWLSSTNLDNPTEPEAQFTSEEVEQLRTAFSNAGADLSMVSLHALLDYARLQNTNDRSSFTTNIYLEADGVTNGPINAMALMTPLAFNERWLNNIRKGGLTIGSTQTMADIRQEDPHDLYQASTDATREHLSHLRDQLSQQKNNAQEAVGQMDQLLSLMDLFSPDITFDPDRAWKDGALEMKRGIAKNPLTITVYGSGAAGIAGKLVGELTSGIYERFSQVIKARKSDPGISLADAMFPNDPDAQTKMDRFQQAYNALTRNMVEWKKGQLVLVPSSARRSTFNPQTFTFSKEELQALESNMLELFVKPMRQGIEDTVGSELMRAVGLVRDAAQIQSIITEYQFVKGINDALTQKEENDPNWKRGDFLSRKDMQKIQKSLQGIAPLVKTGDQSFMITSNQKLELKGRSLTFGSALDGTMETDPSIYAPGQAGVRAIPMLTIGMGDGMMMQLLAQLGLDGTLKIFDGMNMPLDKIKEYSLQANEAVYESWKGNPLAEMAKTYEIFLKNLDDDSINEITKDALIRVLYDFDERPTEETWDVTDIRDRIDALLSNLKWTAESIDARHKAIQAMPVSLDQMAAAAAPYTNGRPDPGLNQEQVLAELNRLYIENMNRVEQTEEVSVAPVQKLAPAKPSPEVEKVGRVHSTGARVLSWTALTNLGRTNAMTDAQKTIFGEIRRSLAARDYKVISGSVEQLDAYIEQKGLSVRPNQEVFGWTNIADKTIFLVNPTMETLVHELVHASSYETLLAFYNRENLGPNAKDITDAIARLETMMEEFLTLGENQMDPAFRAAYESAREAISSTNLEPDQAVAQAKALNEFMAWAMTNEQLTKTLKQKQAPSLVQLAKNAIKAIKNLIWGRKLAPKPVDDFLSNLQFNSGIVIRSQPSIASINRNGELFHAPFYGTNDRLTKVRQAFGKKIVDLLGSEKFQRGKKLRQVEVSEAQMAAIEVALSFNAHGFSMTPQESVTFRMMVAALATEAEIDANALARAQELYTHVVKNLTVEHFMADPESTDPAMRYYAQEKYDSVVGKNLTRTDSKGRTSLLPAFLGLATVSDEFRAVLQQLPVPKRSKNKEGSLDAMLENTAGTVMDALSNRLAGDVGSQNVQDAIDNLLQRIRVVAQDEQSILDQHAQKAGTVIDRVNQAMVDSMEKLSDIAMEKADQVEKNSKLVINRTAARFGKLLASVVSEKNGLLVSEQTMAMLNKANIWEPFHTLINDLVGRTQSNKLVYDMIKVTRSMVQQVRQQFREETPRIIMSKFKSKITEGQWSTMFRAMAKTDLALLRDTMSHGDIHNLFVDQTALDTEINKLEQQIQTNDPKHWNLIQKKARQLATFMNTGVPGANLLRNADAIASLFGEQVTRGYKIPPKNIIKAIDKLVTLYSVESLSQEDRTSMASLVQGEADGLSFTLDYLVGQRKEEASKAAGTKALLNSYKGFIPSEQEMGVSIIVANDSEFLKLKERGYVRVAPYVGSSTERGLSSRSYYYSPLSGRQVFNQGILQNVRHTSGGVDSITGFSINQMAGRITDRHQVRRLARLMGNETNPNEALLPIYNNYGNVIAFERPLAPVQWQRVKPSQHLPKMIGIWRGRQAEEGMSQIFNEKLIDNLHAMYKADMKESSSNQKQYVNLLDPKSLDAVRQDAVNLFTDQTLDYIRDKFGEQFWVRRDMLNDAIGYRSASVGDAWTGTSTWSKETQDTIRKLAVGAFGIEAYKYAVKGEQIIQNFMADARTWIVVKSMIVPMVNFTSNIYQLISRGVPILSIARGLPRKLGEIDNYAKTRLRYIDAEAELRAAAGDPIQERKLKAEIQSIEDAWKRLSIWPLIEAGEFSTIADVGMTHEDLELTSGKLSQYMEKLVHKLPESVKNAGRYALVTRDTALFQGLQKSVQYGDFIAKAVLYDDLTKRQGKSEEYALGRITEEFVNYDRLPGRFRSYLENMGLLWFYNFKIRISKIAVSTIRNNPLHALIAFSLPSPDLFGSAELPQTDNLFAKVVDGTLDYSMGPEMGLRAPFLNPWWNLVN